MMHVTVREYMHIGCGTRMNGAPQECITCCPPWSRLHELDASLSAARLPAGVSILVSFLAAEQEGVRFASAQVQTFANSFCAMSVTRLLH